MLLAAYIYVCTSHTCMSVDITSLYPVAFAEIDLKHVISHLIILCPR